MSDYVTKYEQNRQRLIDAGAYNPEDERDACGVGLVVALAAVHTSRGPCVIAASSDPPSVTCVSR